MQETADPVNCAVVVSARSRSSTVALPAAAQSVAIEDRSAANSQQMGNYSGCWLGDRATYLELVIYGNVTPLVPGVLCAVGRGGGAIAGIF